MSAQTPTQIVRAVEAALRRAHTTTPQETLADRLGLMSHSNVSRKLTALNNGELDSLLGSYSGLQLVTLLANDAVFADALCSALKASEAGRGDDAVRALRQLGKQFSNEVGEIIDDLDDNHLDDREVENHLDAIDQISAGLAKARANLLQSKARGRTA